LARRKNDGSIASAATDFFISIHHQLSFTSKLFRFGLSLSEIEITASIGMKRFILAAVTTIALSGLMVANAPAIGSTIAASDPQGVGPTFKMAMGPTSAAHVPGGSADGPRDTSSTCAPPCPRQHKRAKHRHRSS
jgi:hypothetical protein